MISLSDVDTNEMKTYINCRQFLRTPNMEDTYMSFTEQEVGRFRDEGYLLKPGIYSQADLQPLKDAINNLVDTESRRLPRNNGTGSPGR